MTQSGLSPIRTSVDTGEIIKALAQFQGEITQPDKNKTVDINGTKGTYSFKYSELGNSIEHVRAAWKSCGLAWFSVIVYAATGRATLVTRFNHVSGQWIESDYMLPATNDPKHFAAEVTYGRRYSYTMLTGMATEADADEIPDKDKGAASGQQRGGYQKKGPVPNRVELPPQQAPYVPGQITAPVAAAQPALQAPPAKPVETRWTPCLADLNIISTLIKDKTRKNPQTGEPIVWNSVQLAEFIQTKYGVEAVSDLNQLQYQELRMVIRFRDVQSTFSDLKLPDFQSFKDTPIGETAQPTTQEGK